jgi:hypothetical protein
MPLVLVQNPVIVNDGYEWKDIEGVQYHFPNQYKNRCVPGTPFVYYRGTRRADGTRAVGEYFGHGRIDEVRRDETIPESSPKRNWAWYCGITDYEPFHSRVPAKTNGEFLEKIARNHWSVGIRDLPQGIFEEIMHRAGIAPDADQVPATLPDLDAITVKEAEGSLLVPRRKSTTGRGPSDLQYSRHSRNAARLGRRAEEIALRFLREYACALGARDIRWISDEGLTPGWDIQYEDNNGEIVAIEVKGTSGPLFGSIDITVGEWNAAVGKADRYWLYLVANCCGTAPIIQRLQNPARLHLAGEAVLSPVVYRF